MTDIFERMEGYPFLNDLMIEISANAGSYGPDRIRVSIEQFAAESDRHRVSAAIADIDRVLEKLPLSPAEFEDFLNYILESEADVRELLATLRQGLLAALPNKTK